MARGFAGWRWAYLWIRLIVAAELVESFGRMGWRRALHGSLGLEVIARVGVGYFGREQNFLLPGRDRGLPERRNWRLNRLLP